MSQVEEEKVSLQCPECGSRHLMVRGGRVICVCGADGTAAYFTVAERPVTGERVISRTFDTALDRPDGQHVASVNAALMLLIQAANEDSLELDWGTLRLITSVDGTVVNWLAVIKAYEKPPPPVHELGGATSWGPDGKILVRPLDDPGGRTSWRDLLG